MLSLISGLAAYFGNKDQDISAELNIVLKRVKDGEKADAVRLLAKIAENMLKEKAKNEDAAWYSAFKNPAKIGLQNLCEWAKKTGFFNELEFNLALHMKDIRNDGSHNLNVEGKVDYNEEMFALHAGVKIMQKIVVA